LARASLLDGCVCRTVYRWVVLGICVTLLSLVSQVRPATGDTAAAGVFGATGFNRNLETFSATNGISAVNRKGITIRNGTIRGFYRGVYLQGGAASQGHLVEDVVSEGGKYAGLWIEGLGSVVRRSRVRNTTGTTVLPDSETYGSE